MPSKQLQQHKQPRSGEGVVVHLLQRIWCFPEVGPWPLVLRSSVLVTDFACSLASPEAAAPLPWVGRSSMTAFLGHPREPLCGCCGLSVAYWWSIRGLAVVSNSGLLAAWKSKLLSFLQSKYHQENDLPTIKRLKLSGGLCAQRRLPWMDAEHEDTRIWLMASQRVSCFSEVGPSPLVPRSSMLCWPILGGSFGLETNIRKILVSVKFLSAILGPKMAAPILWSPGKNALFLQENPCP